MPLRDALPGSIRVPAIQLRISPADRPVPTPGRIQPRNQELDRLREIVRLSAMVYRAGQHPRDRQTALLNGLLHLLGAARGSCTVTHLDHRTGEHRVHSRVSSPATRCALAATADADPDTPALLPPCLETFLSLQGMQVVARIELHRSPGAPRFTPAERAMADVLHGEFAWVYGLGAPAQRL